MNWNPVLTELRAELERVNKAISALEELAGYQRQIRSHARGPCDSFHDFAKRLAYGFVALSPNTS
jgi:hypothetical protein